MSEGTFCSVLDQLPALARTDPPLFLEALAVLQAAAPVLFRDLLERNAELLGVEVEHVVRPLREHAQLTAERARFLAPLFTEPGGALATYARYVRTLATVCGPNSHQVADARAAYDRVLKLELRPYQHLRSDTAEEGVVRSFTLTEEQKNYLTKEQKDLVDSVHEKLQKLFDKCKAVVAAKSCTPLVSTLHSFVKELTKHAKNLKIYYSGIFRVQKPVENQTDVTKSITDPQQGMTVLLENLLEHQTKFKTLHQNNAYLATRSSKLSELISTALDSARNGAFASTMEIAKGIACLVLRCVIYVTFEYLISISWSDVVASDVSSVIAFVKTTDDVLTTLSKIRDDVSRFSDYLLLINENLDKHVYENVWNTCFDLEQFIRNMEQPITYGNTYYMR